MLLIGVIASEVCEWKDLIDGTVMRLAILQSNIVYFNANLCVWVSIAAFYIVMRTCSIVTSQRWLRLGMCRLEFGQFFIFLECLWSILIVQAPDALHKLEIIIVHFANYLKERQGNKETTTVR